MQVLVVADDAHTLMPLLHCLTTLMYPLSWRHAFIPILPATNLMELDSPFPFLLGITRAALPRGRAPPNVCHVHPSLKTHSLTYAAVC